jgi:DNA modification methylase
MSRPIRPYFKEGNITIYNGDCLSILPQLNLGSKVLLFTDPPYGIGESKKKNRDTIRNSKVIKSTDFGDKEWDNQPPPPEYFEYILNNTKDQIIFGGNYFTDWLHNTPCYLMWDKLNSGDFADCEIAWTSFKSAIRKFAWKWNGMLQHTEPGKSKEVRVHPTQKPVGLAKNILKKYYDKEKYDLVLDTHMGSGSFGVACKELNIPYIGIDQDLEYCEAARFRLASLKAVSELTTEKKGMFY